MMDDRALGSDTLVCTSSRKEVKWEPLVAALAGQL